MDCVFLRCEREGCGDEDAVYLLHISNKTLKFTEMKIVNGLNTNKFITGKQSRWYNTTSLKYPKQIQRNT